MRRPTSNALTPPMIGMTTAAMIERARASRPRNPEGFGAASGAVYVPAGAA